jgi:hypothetical protein
MVSSRSRLVISATSICLFLVSLAFLAKLNLAQSQTQTTSTEPNLTEEEKIQFLLKAKVTKFTQTSKGITRPYRLTLSDGTLTHDAAFQSVDESSPQRQTPDGKIEIGFRDTYHFNIAAYELAKLLGIAHMMPVTVERKWEGKTGSLTWWLPIKMDERERLEKKIVTPDPDVWNKQMYRARVFKELVYDTDRNLTNTLIGEDWKLYVIDFTRAFRLHKNIEYPKDLVQCDRQLLEKLRGLDEAVLLQKTKPHLGKDEVKSLLARRDKIVAHFEQLIKEKGESEILY